MSVRRILLALLGGAILGFSIFGVLVYRATSVESVEPADAARRLAAVRATIGGRPLLTLDEAGSVVRRADPPSTPPERLTRLGVLAYQASGQRLVLVDVPFWFFKLKGPAAQYVVSGTGLDLERLQITAADLERYGPAIVIDHARPDGSHLLVWTE